MEYNKLVKSDPNKSITLAKKEAALSSSESLTSMVFLSSSNYNRLLSRIADLRQDMLKINNYYPMNVTSAYDMITRFELAYPRHNHT